MNDQAESSVRQEVRTWLQENWNPDLTLVEWRNKLADSGWGVPGWPVEWYGRDLPAAVLSTVEEEFAASLPNDPSGTGIRMLAAATILEHGSDAHKEEFLRRILTGDRTGPVVRHINHAVTSLELREKGSPTTFAYLTQTVYGSIKRQYGQVRFTGKSCSQVADRRLIPVAGGAMTKTDQCCTGHH